MLVEEILNKMLKSTSTNSYILDTSVRSPRNRLVSNVVN